MKLNRILKLNKWMNLMKILIKKSHNKNNERKGCSWFRIQVKLTRHSTILKDKLNTIIMLNIKMKF